MKQHKERIALRLPSQQRQEIDKLVKDGKYRTLSEFFRHAIRSLLEKENKD